MSQPTKSQEDTLERLIVNTSLVDILSKKIRDGIHSGKYLPGQKLIVRELSEELNVSHTPIKEALHRLVAEGYVEAPPRKSMVVKRVTYQDYEQNMEIRVMCELFALPTLVALSPDQLGFTRDMQEDVEQMAQVLDAPGELDYNHWLELDGVFHRRYMSVVENTEFGRVYASLKANRNSYFAFLENTKHPLTMDFLRKDNEEHRKIVDAIQSRNLSQLTDAITTHILRPRFQRQLDTDTRMRIERVVQLYR
ncbi:MAG: GntR family transcriptional regulator [Eubacteriales bacterium]|jgi:DNA-binding GntR family transcriptional regulator